MKKRIFAVLFIAVFFLTAISGMAFAADKVGDGIVLDGKTHIYQGDITNTGFLLDLTADIVPAEGAYGAGTGYLTFYLDDSGAWITLYNATLDVEDTDAIGIYGTNLYLEGKGDNNLSSYEQSAIYLYGGDIYISGDIASLYSGYSNVIFCYDNMDNVGGNVIINGNVGVIAGDSGSYNINAYKSVIVNGTIGEIYGHGGIFADCIEIPGTIDYIIARGDSALWTYGPIIINGKIGQISAYFNGIESYGYEEDNVFYSGSITIRGEIGSISSEVTIEGAERAGLYVSGGDIYLASTAKIGQITDFEHCLWADGGKVNIYRDSQIGLCLSYEEAILETEWPSSWARAEVNYAIYLGIVPESLQCSYTAPITRAEYCALAVNLYEGITGEEITERKTFTDTNDANVEKMAAVGVVNGTGDGTVFSPNAQLTREQAATMLARLAAALSLPIGDNEPNFTDKAQISSWAYDAVGQVQLAGIMNGTGDGSVFTPKGTYTREQSILTMVRIWDMYEMFLYGVG